MDEVFLDLETKRWFDEVGKRDPAKLGISLKKKRDLGWNLMI